MISNDIGSPGSAPVTIEDARALWKTTDLVSIGIMADEARRKRHGDRVTYLRVHDLALLDAAAAPLPEGAGEIRLTGSAPSALADAVAVVQPVVARAAGTPVSAFELGDLEQVTGGGVALVEYLRGLADAGLAGLAEVRLDRLGDGRRALDALAAAGLRSLRFTIDQVPVDVPALLHELRQLQRHTGAMHSFAPLPRQQDASMPTTGYQDVKAVALARLVLDNVTSVQVDWSSHGPKLAQVALLFGADDIDGVAIADEASQGRRRAPREEVRRNVEAASFRPVERDGRFAVRE
jgi:aminodeoxyfutalosine synthase